jgi:hypothetical protein
MSTTDASTIRAVATVGATPSRHKTQRICKFIRRVQDVAISVEGLWISNRGAGRQRVDGGESPMTGVVVSRLSELETGFVVLLVAGVILPHIRRVVAVAVRAADSL